MLEKMDILDVLLDEDNKEPIVLMDENGKEIEFEQVAIVPMDDVLYCVLKPITEIEGIGNDEAIVFYVEKDEEKGENVIKLEEDEEKAIMVFQKYYDLLEEANKEIKKEKKTKKK